MDTGQVVYITSRLAFGALAAFFAIMLWSKTRDAAWMLMVIGIIAGYGETVYSILKLFGVIEEDGLAAGSLPLTAITLSNLPTIFFLSAFIIMVVRKYGKKP